MTILSTGAMETEARFWLRIEGEGAADPMDADHWIRVYSELLATLGSMREASVGPPPRIKTLIRVFEERRAFWLGVLNDAPVRDARERASETERTHRSTA